MKGRNISFLYFCLFFVCLVYFVVLCFPSSAAGAEADAAADEEALRAARLPADGPSLLKLFRKRTPDADSQARITALIVQLGSDSFSEREEASEELARSGVAAVGLLRKATHHADLEIRRRVRDALALIEQNDLSADVLISALRVLGRRKPPQLAEVLLDYAPHAADADLIEELCLALASGAVRNGDADPRLVRALTDKSPIPRGIAGAALCRGGCRKHLPAVRRLLHDPDMHVRRRVALALLEMREKAAVPVLIELLAQLPPAEAEQVESILLQLAGDAAPPPTLPCPAGGEGRVGDGKYRDAWAEWWKQYGDGLDLSKIELAPRWRGYTLAVCNWMDRRAVGATGCIFELDAQGRTRWQMKGLSWPVDAQVVDEKRILVTEYSPGQVTERNRNGDVLRRIHVPGTPLEAQRLPNGNTLITTRSRVFEVDRNDKEVWAINDSGGMIVAACPLRGGEVGVCRRRGDFLRLDLKGNVLASFRVGRMFRPYGMHIQGLPNGHVLVPLYYDNKVAEFDKNGREVWTASYPRPMCAQRLPNGRTLVSGYGSKVFAELDKNGRTVKRKSIPCTDQLMSVRQR